MRSDLSLSKAILAAMVFCCGVSHSQQAAPKPDPEPRAVVSAAPIGGAPRLYIEPQNGLESYVAAAIVKKHVPIVVTENVDQARFVLTGGVESKEESTGSKIARCLFVYCAGIAGTQIATVRLIDTQTQEVLWAYTVKKAGAHNYQSSAEAIAKHLKHFLEEQPR